MNRLAYVFFCLLALLPSLPARPAEEGPMRVTPPFPWARGLGAPPRIPLVGDVNGDGYADLLSLWAKGKWTVKSLSVRGMAGGSM